MNRKLGVLTTAAVLALPATAFAHGSVYQSTAKVGATRTDETRYVITNHGFTYVLTEDNGLTGVKGMVAYNLIPSAWRTGKTKTEILTAGGTGAQPHATCTGVPALESEATILSWQGADPFYNYIPFQSAAAGLEDDPATWLPKLTAAGFDTSKLGDAATAKAECEKVPGAVYVRADKTATTTASLAAGTVEPLEEEITALKATNSTTVGQNAALTIQVATLTTDLTAAKTQIAGLMLSARPMTLALSGATATVSGPPLRAVTVTLSVSAAEAKKLKLKSTVIGKQTATTSAAGTATITVKPIKAVRSLKRSLKVTAGAVSGDRFASAKSTFKK
jgi:hypothetical protein